MTKVTIDMLIGKLVAFELSEFGSYLPKTGSRLKATISEKQRYDLENISTRVSKYEKETLRSLKHLFLGDCLKVLVSMKKSYLLNVSHVIRWDLFHQGVKKEIEILRSHSNHISLG